MYISITMCPEYLYAELIDAINENDSLKTSVRRLSSDNQCLKDRIDWLEKRIYGQKSERYIQNDLQTELPLDIEKKEVEKTTVAVSYERTVVKPTEKQVKDSWIPPHLPRVDKVIEPDFDTTDYIKMGEKITEELNYKPAEFFVLRTIRPILKKNVNGEVVIKTPELPARCIDKGIAGASVVAQLLTTKCVDHNPLYRFQDQVKRQCNVDIPYSTLSGWFGQGAYWLEGLVPALQSRIYESGYFQIDETTIRVMIEPTKGKSHLGYMVQLLSPELKIVTFHYMKTRNIKNIKELIPSSYKGKVQTDGLNLYDFLDYWDGISHVNCHAHSRRGFKEALDNDPERARWMLDKYKELFEVERIAKQDNLTGTARLKLRQESSKPIIEEMKSWLDKQLREVTPKSLIGKAIGYTLNRWNGLIQFLDDGAIELSNNLVENGFRKMALGKRNFMFTKTEQGAMNLATIYSVLGTCYLHGINPFTYLCDVLEKLPSRMSNNIADLLPMNWKPPVLLK